MTELELSAQDPWTRTMLDLGPLAVVFPALACAELVIPAVSSSPAAAGDAASAAMRLLVCTMARMNRSLSRYSFSAPRLL